MAKQTILGACPHDCPDTCSMHVNVEDGKVVSVGGNPEHPFTKGRLCVKVNNYQDRVNSPDRILYPLKRVGPKGSGNYERIGWDDALNEIKLRWNTIINNEGASSILPYSYLGTQGIINGLSVGDPFFNRLGASISERTFCDSGAIAAYIMTIGASAAVDPESFVHSKYIILWACNTLSTNSHHWPFIAAAKKRGAKVVVIDPFKTRTAQLADWHLPIRPGTDGALALAMMNVIIEEGLTDDDYIAKYTVGYEGLKQRVASYPPESVAKITGISSDDIRKLAREFATTQPAVIRIGVAIERHAGGGQAVRAISCIAALTSAWRHVGGGMLHMPLWAFPVNWDHLQRPDLIGDNPRVVNQWKLGKVLTNEMDLAPPINALFIYNSNPVIVAPEQDKIIEGLSREDLFTVVSEQFMTDTARYADIILPATTQLEQEEIMFSWGHLYLSYNNRAIKPLGEAVSNSELFRRLAKIMDFNDDPYFVRDDDQMIKESLNWDDPALDGITIEQLKLKGFARLNVPN
ncbi:MAG: molybdopterin-dependent oxidoreductase, partial [Paraglaciecola sp.]|nr:molybdopterin-dependent oxidoreductase [Paraglaciecola sp.]